MAEGLVDQVVAAGEDVVAIEYHATIATGSLAVAAGSVIASGKASAAATLADAVFPDPVSPGGRIAVGLHEIAIGFADGAAAAAAQGASHANAAWHALVGLSGLRPDPACRVLWYRHSNAFPTAGAVGDGPRRLVGCRPYPIDKFYGLARYAGSPACGQADPLRKQAF